MNMHQQTARLKVTSETGLLLAWNEGMDPYSSLYSQLVSIFFFIPSFPARSPEPLTQQWIPLTKRPRNARTPLTS